MQVAFVASNILNLFSVYHFGVYSFCCKITIEAHSKLPAIFIKTRYIAIDIAIEKILTLQKFLYTPDFKLSHYAFWLVVGCSSFSSIPSKLNYIVNTRCFSWPICTWSLEVVALTSSSCFCSSIISPLFFSSNPFTDSFSLFSSLHWSLVIKSSDNVLLRCSLHAISRWFCRLLLLSYAKICQQWILTKYASINYHKSTK